MPIGTFLNGDSPSQLRGLLWLALSDGGRVGTRTSTSDSGGGVTQSWTYGGTIPCRIDPVTDRGDAHITGGAVDERSTHVVTCPPGTSVAPDNRFVVLNRGTFEVTATHRQTGEQSTTFEVVEAS